jgi:hypothetical protein
MNTPPAFLDGSNLLLNVSSDGLPSVFIFACIFDALRERGFAPTAAFDDSIRHHLNKLGVPEEWDTLTRLRVASRGAITMAPWADGPVLVSAEAAGGYVVLHGDRYKDVLAKRGKLPKMIRVLALGDQLSFTFVGDEARSFAIRIPDTITLFGEHLRRRLNNGGSRAMEILPSENQLVQSLEARLIVFALDASGSMHRDEDGARQTYDGRRKSEHLSEVLRGVVERLKVSNVRNSFFVSLVNFAGAPYVHTIRNAKMAHIGHAAEYILSPRFDYRANVSGSGTNIARALEASVKLIDDVLSDPANGRLASEWHALIVLITDGQDTKSRQAVIDFAATIAVERAALESRRIRLACVGIGNTSDIRLLTEIASEADATDLDRFGKAGLRQHLQTAPGLTHPSLVIKVDATDKAYQELIRLFIDVVSHSG